MLTDLVLVLRNILGHGKRFLNVQIHKLAVSVADDPVCLVAASILLAIEVEWPMPSALMIR